MRRDALQWAQKITLIFIVVIALSIILLSIRASGVITFGESEAIALTPAPAMPVRATPGHSEEIRLISSPTIIPLPPTSTPTPSGPAAIRVAIIAGHHGNDSGAVCPDGLREADINLAVAERVMGRLQRKGYTVDLLEEFDDRIQGYKGDVFISIHADSCIPGLSGFKIARSETSAIPEIEDLLTQCIITEYEEKTGMSFHADSISEHMRDYHAFREIAYDTPGVIIELGFMSDDRNILLYRQDRVAKSLVDGIQCFLDNRDQLQNP